VFPVAAATMAGWLILFFVLLAGRLRQDGFGATLLDLAARGWFSLSKPPGRGGTRRPAAPAMCVVPLVHARVGLWKPRQVTVWPAEPAAVARPLADPGVPFDPRASG
jgi:hypothetical protein